MAEIFDCAGGCGRTVKMFHGRKTRLCRRCAGAATAARPDAQLKKSAAMKRLFQVPGFRERHVERCSAAVRELMETSAEFREQRRQAGRRLGKSGAGHEARHMKWCPLDLRPAYRALIAAGASRPEARREIERRMEAKRARQGRRLSFEEQLEAVRNGAGLVPKFTVPADTGPYTLGGVASGML